MKRRSRLWTTYLLAVAAGWAGVRVIVPREKLEAADGMPRDRRERAVPDAKAAGAELLGRLMAEEKGKPTEENRFAEGEKSYRARMEELRGTLVPAADRGQAVMDAQAACLELESPDSGDAQAMMEARARLSVRLLQWLEEDPEAALTHMRPLLDVLFAVSSPSVQLWASERSRAEVLARLSAEPENSSLRGLLERGMLSRVCSTGDLAGLEELREQLPPGRFMEMQVGRMLEDWPQERLGELASKTLEWKDAPLLARTLGAMTAADATSQFQTLVATEEGRAVLKRAGSQLGGLLEKLYRNDALSLDQRVALMKQMYTVTRDTPPSMVVGRIRNYEYEDFAKSGEMDVLMRSYKAGEMDTRTVEQAVLVGMRESALLDPKGAREQVFQKIANRDPVRAMALLDDLPPAERYRQAMSLARGGLYERSPVLLYQIQEAVPPDAANGLPNEREDQWKEVTRFAQQRYDDQYRRWVENLPAGPNRDLALGALANQVAEDDPGQAGELRAKISKPEVAK